MEVKVARTAGFCFGVKRAVDKVYEQINISSKPIYTYGPIIHNEEVVRDLEEKGVEVINSIEELKNLKDSTLIIRSHGVAKNVYDIAENNGLEIVDATCPFVKRIHDIVKEAHDNNMKIVIIGNPKHPEVEGIVGWAGNDAIVINDKEDIEKIKCGSDDKLFVVSQTTFNYEKFDYFVEIIKQKGYDIKCVNTICNATHERQVEARTVASEVDAMIVIGGRNSSNTQKLYEICKEQCDNTYFIQTVNDLDMRVLESVDCVGITAGASTPNKIIEEVHTNVRNEF